MNLPPPSDQTDGSTSWGANPPRRSPHRSRHLPTEAAATGLFNGHFPAGPRRRDLKPRHRLVRRSAVEMLLVTAALHLLTALLTLCYETASCGAALLM